jgi:fibronectin-binding autotransporter adhesin
MLKTTIGKILRRSILGVGLAVVLLGMAGRLQAQDYWQGTTSGNWGTAANWNPAAVPANTTILYFGYGNVTGNSSVTMAGTAGGAGGAGFGPAVLNFNSTQNFALYNGTLMFQQHGTGADDSGIFVTGNTGNVTITTAVTETGSKNDDIILQNDGTGTLTLAQNTTAGDVTGNIDLLQEALIVNGSGATVISNNITGDNLGPTTNFNPTPLNFQASGTGTVTLSGNNVYTGDSELDSGVLNLNSSTALGGNSTAVGAFIITGGTLDNTSGGTITLANNNAQSWYGDYSFAGTNDLNMGNGSVTLENTIGINVIAGNLTENGVISGDPTVNSAAFGLSKIGDGTLILGAANTYTGNTTLLQGTLELTSNLALQDSTLNYDGGSLNFSTLNNATLGGLAGTFGTSLALSNSTAGAVALTVGNNGSSTLFSGNLTGPGSLTKVGTGTLTLDGQETYTGATTINNGTLELDFSSAITQSNITSNTSALVLGGGTLDVNGNSGHTNLQVFNGTTINAGASNVTVAQNGALSMNVTLGALTRNFGGTVNFAPTGGANISTSTANTSGNAITSGGVAYATMNGTDWATIGTGGNIVAMAAANYTTSTTVTSWTGANVSLSANPATNVTANTAINTLRFTGSSTIGINAGTTLTISTGGLLVAANDTGTDIINGGTVKGASGGELVVLQNDTTNALTINSVIADNTSATGLTKSGLGTLVLGGVNTFTGNTTLNQGTLQLNVGTALQDSIVNLNGGNLSFGGVTSASFNGLQGTQDLSLTNNTSTAVGLTVGNGTNSFATTYSGNLSGLGNLTLHGASGSSLTLAGTSTYAGNTTINGGTLIIGAAGALPTGGNVVLANTAGAGLNLNGFDGNIGILSGGGASGGGIILGAANLTTGSGNSNSAYNGTISGTGGVTKIGSGNLALGATNTYTGATSVNAGTLTLDFNATGAPASNITSKNSALVLNGGTLQINGKSGAPNTQAFSGATVNSGASEVLLNSAAAGNGVNLELGAVTRNAGSTVDFKIAGAGGANITTSFANTSGNAVLSSNIAYMTINGTDWATANAAGNIVAMAAGNYTTSTTVTNWANANVSLSANPASNVTANTTLNTLRFTGASSIGINTGDALIIGTGGLLMASNNTSNVVINGAGLLMTGYGGAANANSELVIIQNDTTGSLTINASIIDNKTGVGSADNGMGLTKSGAGLLILGATNTYIGNTTINAGTIQFDSGLAAQNSTVNYVGGNLSFNTGVGTATLGGLAGTQNLSLTNMGGTAVGLTVGENSFSTEFSGNLTGLGNLTTINGNTTANPTMQLTLLGSGNYAGATTIGLDTTLSVENLANGGSNSSIGDSTAAAGNLVLNAGTSGTATLQYIGAGNTTNRLITLGGNTNGSDVLDASGTGNLTFSNTSAAVLTGNTSGLNLVFTGTNAGNNSFALQLTNNSTGAALTVLKEGIGMWTLTGNNSGYTGATVINDGTLAVTDLTAGGSNSSIGASTNVAGNLVINGGTLQYVGAGNSTDRLFTLGTAGGTLDSSGTGALTMNNTGDIGFGIYNGSTTLQSIANTSVTLTLSGSNTGNNSLAANITNNGSGAVNLVKSGTGLWDVTSTGNYTGTTTIDGGTLRVSTLANGGTNSNIGASSSAASNLVLNGGTLQYVGAGVTSNRSFSLGPWSGTLDASGTGNLTLGTAGTSVIGFTVGNTSPTLTLTGNNAGNNTLAVQVTDNGAGVVNLTKSGTGMWILTENNTLSGIATVNSGTLKLNAATGSALNNVSSVVVNSGGTLLLGASNQINGGALGTVAANMTLNGGTFNTGGFAQASNTLGTLTLSATSNIDLGVGSNSSIVHYDISSSQGWVSGSTLYVDDWNGTFGLINNSTAGGNGPDELFFGSSTSGLTSTQVDQIVFVDPNGLGGNYDAEILDTGEVVPFKPVPEPGTYAAGGALVGLAGWWEWRRRRAAKT